MFPQCANNDKIWKLTSKNTFFSIYIFQNLRKLLFIYYLIIFIKFKAFDHMKINFGQITYKL